jgi:hypothetical protein
MVRKKNGLTASITEAMENNTLVEHHT